MSREWIKTSERSSDFWMRLIRWIALHLGRPSARLLLWPITLFYYVVSPQAVRDSRRYLSRVLERKVGFVDVYRHLHSFASTILDRVFLLSGREDLLDVRIHNADDLHARVAQGQGCILLGSHLGSFEVLRALGVHQKRFPLRVLMYPDHNQTVTRLLNVLSPEVAETVIPLGRVDTLLKVKESLEQGELIGMLGDRVAESDKQLGCNFMGETARFPAGPLLLAVTLKVPVILFYGLYRGGNRYDIHFELLTEAPEVTRSERQGVIEELTCRYAARLEYYARQAPYNWFNFYDYWRKD
jgi:predicted LPLAT superfamily acyltransferase